MKLTVVIVSYNVKFYLEQCLNALSRALKGVDAEVYVVDNHSKDESAEYLVERFPSIKMIASPHNLGFARANNMAIRDSQSKYVLLLNPDTVVGEDTVKKALEFMDCHPDAGALGVKMLDTTGAPAKESRRGLPSPMVAFYKMVGLCSRFPKSRRFGRYYMGGLPWDSPAQIEVVSGAFCMLNRKALEQVGCLDEDFFMYGEDIDLSYRILKAGFHNYYLPAAILHYKGESTQKSSFRYVHVFYEAMLIFFKKHYSGMSFLLSLPIKLAIYAKAVLALFRMQAEKARKSLGFVTCDWKSSRYLFVGGKEVLDCCNHLALRKGLQADFLECDKLSLASKIQLNLDMCDEKKSIRYIVFDVCQFSFEQIFSVFSANKDKMNRMAFFHSNVGILITENEVLW